MKKKISFILLLSMLFSLFTNITNVSAYSSSYGYSAECYNYFGEKKKSDVEVTISDLSFEFDGSKVEHIFENLNENEKNLIYTNMREEEYMIIFNIAAKEDILITEEQMEIDLCVPTKYGGRTPLFGKDYRMYYISSDELEEIDITSSSVMEIEAYSNKIGTYVLYYNPAVYEVTFFSEKPTYDEDGNCLSEEYFVAQNLKKDDKIIFPQIPQRDGYVFSGWLNDVVHGWKRRAEYVDSTYTAHDCELVYPCWTEAEEYTSLELVLSADEPIKSGEEDGKTLTLTLSEGKFTGFSEFDWYTAYQEAQSDEEREELIAYQKSKWNIIGNDDLMVKNVERIDDRNVRIILLGNSLDASGDSNIKLEFNSGFFNEYIEDEEDNIVGLADVQLDEDGVKKAMFASDNAVTIEGEKLSAGVRGGGGGGSTVSRYTVKFETNSDAKINPQTVNKNETATKPEAISKDGYVFDGWYTDSAFTTPYDFNGGVAKNITLYAKWVEEEVTEENKEIILTIGENKINVFGEEKENDVAPVIENDITMLPARFIAEALGANVVWDKEAKSVIIEKDDVKLVITIGEKTAQINGETVELFTPAFIRNDRTYTPIRLISEALGASVEWFGETNTVVITAK